MTAMNVIGAPARHPLQALARLLPTDKPLHLPPRKQYPPRCIQLVASNTGITAYADGSPVAWIVTGYHQGQVNNKTKRCDFVDVAYHRKTNNGVNMETADFLTLEEAVNFIANVFGGAIKW